MLRDGKKPFEIIDTTGFSCSLVASVRKNMGWPAFPTGTWSRKKSAIAKAKAEALRLKIAGFTYKEIGLRLGVCRQRIQQYLKVPESERRQRPDCCEKCGKSGVPLHCHHTNYGTGEFELLCRPCHSLEHHKKSPGHHLPERFKSNAS